MSKRTILKAVIGSAIALSLSTVMPAYSQNGIWPSKPIKFITPFPPGGPADTGIRYIAAKLGEALGQPVIVENVAGMGGGIGMGKLAQAPADGYTLGYGHTGTMAINPHMYSNLKYNPLKDFTPVARLYEYVNVLVVNPKEPYKNLADLINAAKTKPGLITFGSAGNGSSNHLSAELLAKMAGVKFSHIPYKGSGPAMTDLLGGNINFMFDVPVTSLQYMHAGRLRALATTGRIRLKQEPDLPTVSESLPGYEMVGWSGVFAPAGVPPEIINRLTTEIANILRMPGSIERFTAQGYEIAYGTPEQLGAVMRKDLAFWGPIVKASGAKND